MKKKFEIVKTLQLILLIVITGIGLYFVFTDAALYQMIGHDASVRVLSLLLWSTIVLSFLFILWDYNTINTFKKDYRELDYAVYNDHIAGIANRYSCDAMIEKYVDKPLPNHIGCIMMDLSNIRDINANFGHLKGNATIQDFSNILHTASLGLCFVGRNGGNKFMALFEDCSEDRINTFLTRVQKGVENYNKDGDSPDIEYRTGRAFAKDETCTDITQLISLSDRRLAAQQDDLTGFANRSSCDDIINLYADKELPQTIGCVMLDIANIGAINNACGHLEGNRAIRLFGDILRDSSSKLCFVGRNGGTKFLALFENCSDEKIDQFLGQVKKGIETANGSGNNFTIEYRFGKAFHEGEAVKNINQLVALSDRRLRGVAE